MPSLDEAERAAMARHSGFARAAVLVFFPTTLDDLAEEFARHGITVGAMTPSVVVRDRLSRRYTVSDRTGRPCGPEIFAMVTPPERPTSPLTNACTAGQAISR